MKAVILAGGENDRLQPMSAGRPTCMVPLFDRPLLEYEILWLKKHAITDIYIVLRQPAQEMKESFADGARLGVRLTYRVEELPQGTAGSVKSCRQLLGDEPFLVVHADAVCDLDLTAAIRFHRERGGEATLLLARHPAPSEYGQVIADREGRVSQIVEASCWGQVVSDAVSTGICILSPAVLERLTEEEERLDLGRDILAAMVRRGEAVYACRTQGYWREVEDCRAYLECAADALSAKVRLEPGTPCRRPGIWSAQPLPEDIELVPPCWIGPDVEIGSGSLIGPHTMLGRGSRVGRRAMVQRSVINAGRIGDRAVLYGAIVCRGAQVGQRCVLNEGTVLAERSQAQAGAVLMERVCLWPGRTAPADCRLTRSLLGTGRRENVRFSDGVIYGTLGEDMTPELLLTLGGILGKEGQIGLGCFGGPGAEMLARAAASGIAAAGGVAAGHDMQCAAQAAWLGERQRLPGSLFVEQTGERIFLHLFNSRGLPPGREVQHRLERGLERGETVQVAAERVGGCRRLYADSADYCRDAARRGALYRRLRYVPEVAVSDRTPEDRAIRGALEALGCRITDRWRKGIPAFMGGHGGFRLTAQEESGALLSGRQLLAMVALVELENADGRLAVPGQAGAALEVVAAGFGKQVLHPEQDGDRAEQIYQQQPWLRDAAFAAVRLCARMGATGEKLEQLREKVPHFSLWKREVPLSSDGKEVIRQLIRGRKEPVRSGEGVRLRVGSAWVYLAAPRRRSALKVVVEGPDLELAAELCDDLAEKAARLDRRLERERQTK